MKDTRKGRIPRIKEEDEYIKTIVYRIAATSYVDPRTVQKFLSGQPLRPSIQHRIRLAAKTEGIDLPKVTK